MFEMIKATRVILIFVLLFGCSKQEKPESVETASQVAIAFFDALYNQKNLDKAMALSSPDFAKKLHRHRTAKQVAIRVCNMSYDSVKIEAGLGDSQVRDEFNKTGHLTLLFNGKRREKIFNELKKIRLIKVGEIWLVDGLLADPVPT
jgi:hypothetical protein